MGVFDVSENIGIANNGVFRNGALNQVLSPAIGNVAVADNEQLCVGPPVSRFDSEPLRQPISANFDHAGPIIVGWRPGKESNLRHYQPCWVGLLYQLSYLGMVRLVSRCNNERLGCIHQPLTKPFTRFSVILEKLSTPAQSVRKYNSD